MDQQELNLLRQRVQQLEDLLARDSEKESEVLARVSELEGVVETRTEDMSQEIKRTYGNLNRAWHSIGDLDRRGQQQDSRLQNVGNHLKGVDDELKRLHQRQCELNDADISLEERFVELLDSIDDVDEVTPSRGRQRRESTSDSAATPGRIIDTVARRPRRPSAGEAQSPLDSSSGAAPINTTPQSLVPLRSALSSAPDLWTVHVSLLPTHSQPFPFERNTNAYKRCLSRGLHQMVAVNGTDGDAFVSAVSRAFDGLLKGREWMPLKAKLCDAKDLQGLPMLRPLEPPLIDSSYDVKFLRTHCAVLDGSGKIDSLYIAMRNNTLSWHALRHSRMYLEGLESSWETDPLLDPTTPFDDDEFDENKRPSAGDLVSTFPTLKRDASEMSRSESFGSAAAMEGVEGPRPPKVQRTPCPLPNMVEVRRQGVETV